jgi:large subunit ribosomal protein L5
MSDKQKGQAQGPKSGGQAQKGSQQQKGGQPQKGSKPAADGAPAAPPAPTGPRPTPRLLERYRQDIVPTMMKEFGYKNVMQVPRILKVSVNIGLGEAIQNSKALENATGDLALVTGQKPVVTKARRSIAVYKLREGMSIGAMVTLRGARMWDFIDRLINIVLPRQRDFQGVSPDSFDGRGNYSIGLREQIIFPEIDYDKVDKVRGMEVTIVTSAKTDEEARRVLALLNMPFKR